MATVRMPSSLHAQMTRSAISPRFAISIFLNISDQLRGQPALGYPPGAARLFQCVSSDAKKRARRAPGLPKNVTPASLLRPYRKQLLPIFDGLAVAPHLLHDFTRHVRFNLIQQLHRLDDSQHLPDFDNVSNLYEWRRAPRGRLLKRSDDGGLHDIECFGRRRLDPRP